MPIKAIAATLAAMFLVVGSPGLSAQEIVHATTGTITDGSQVKDSLTIQTPDQSAEVFQVKQALSTPVSFDKVLREKSETVDKLSKGRTHVIVYYFGYSPQTVVAVRDLGTKVQNVNGTVTHVDKSQHTITIHAESGTDSVCYVDSDTAVETANGVMGGNKYSVKKGDKISAVCTDETGKDTAEFIQML
jgi:hypothetical protein